MNKHLFTILFFCFLAVDIHAQKSTVEQFEYGSFEDKKTSTLEGTIMLSNNKTDTIKSDQACMIIVDDHLGIPYKTLGPDSNGHFVIELPKGEFAIGFIKPDYERFLVENYQSHPGQKSTMVILLAKGKNTRSFKLKKWKQS